MWSYSLGKVTQEATQVSRLTNKFPDFYFPSFCQLQARDLQRNKNTQNLRSHSLDEIVKKSLLTTPKSENL